MITYPINEPNNPHNPRFYYGIGNVRSVKPEDKGLILSLKDARLMTEVRVYVPAHELYKLIAHLSKEANELLQQPF